MIDILGMLIPGGLLLLLFEQDIHCLEYLTKLLGVGANNILWIAIYICGSYLIGALLHEIGSAIELLLWRNPLVDPRVFAAVATGHTNLSTTGDQVDNNCKRITQQVVVIIFNLLCVFPAVVVVCLAVGQFNLFMCVLCLLSILVLPFACNFFKLIDAAKNRSIWTAFRGLSPIDIPKEAFSNDENERKYGLFRGYRSLARSLLILLAIAQLYVKCCPHESESYLVGFLEHISTEPRFAVLYVLSVITLVMRYWRFSYLSYIYRYTN